VSFAGADVNYLLERWADITNVILDQ
jgi:hypothetical protein